MASNSSSPLHLIPANDDLHRLAIARDGLCPTQEVAKHSASSLDPALGKDLTKSIKTVSKKVDAAYSSFSAVKRIIGDPALDLCKVDNFRKEWESIEEDFKGTLFESSKVAGEAAAVLFDFVSTIIPYLLLDSDMEIKQQELHSYRSNLNEGSQTARSFSRRLKEISLRTSNFEKDWSQHTSSVDSDLRATIAQLEHDIRELDVSLSEAEGNLASGMRGARFASSSTSDEAPNPPLSKQERSSLIKKKLAIIKKSMLATSKQSQTEAHVTKHAGIIQDNADDLMVVWSLILENVNLIESHLKITESGTSPELFKQRVEKLAGQYESLMVNLKSYSSAITHANGRPNLWRALITIFTRI